jgi:hypothetical protein
MIGAVFQYLWQEARPRFLAIVGSSDFVIAVLLGGAMGLWGQRLGLADAKIVDVTTALLTYSAIAFGFCLSGLTLALVLPDMGFAKQLATSRIKTDGLNSYSNLMFLFSWAALIHWLVIVAAIAIFAYSGSEPKVLPIHASYLHHIAIGCLSFLSIYAICRFLVALITLSQVGRLYIARLATTTTKPA